MNKLLVLFALSCLSFVSYMVGVNHGFKDGTEITLKLDYRCNVKCPIYKELKGRGCSYDPKPL